jgi:anti-sigma factor RsiW
MTSPHLSEQDLQAAAEASALLPAAQVAHLRGCARCQSQVATYQQLFVAVAQLPAPAFSFDLTTSVLAQLPTARPASRWVLGGVAAIVVGVVALFLVLFGSALAQAFQGSFTLLGAGLAVVASVFVAGQCLELLARHRRHMRLLTFS